MRCTGCGEENRDGARFCDACGSGLSSVCAGCGQVLRTGARFCDACGAATAVEAGTVGPPRTDEAAEVRKTITAVFVDLVGSTALQERLDPESVRLVMGRFYEAMSAPIEQYGGRVQKFIGDAVVAVWGVPAVREDDALRALRAAAAMRDALNPLNEELQTRFGVTLAVRTGVNTGEVVQSREGFYVGDTMNTAARLEQNAPTGQILVGEGTWRLVRHAVRLEAVESLAAKGKRAPLRAFRLAGTDPPTAVEGAPGEAVLVGREDELARLLDAFAAAREAGACRLVSVIASPGLGKTRLARELVVALEGEATVLEGRCDRSGEGPTLGPIAEVLCAAAGIADADDPEVALAKLQELMDDDDDDAASRAAGVLGLGPPASPEVTFWAVRRLLESVARRRPLVIVLDDLHWAQPQMLDLVDHLAEWSRAAPILLLALARPELRETRSALTTPGRPVHDVLELTPLDGEASRRMVTDLFGAGLPPALAVRVLETTEGNPLFLGEMLRMLVDDGVLVRENGAWVLDGDADVAVPPTISALLAARIERLRPDERAVVERASVIGKQFYRGAVASLSSATVGADLDLHLETLRRKELVEPEGTYWIDEPVFRFHHVLIRDAAYRGLLKEARAELHERFADWLAGKAGEHEEIIGYHLEQAHEFRGQLGPLDERGRALGVRAAGLLASAGRRALAREDLATAAALLGRAAARLREDDAEGRADLLVDACEALLSAGDVAGARSALSDLRAVAFGDRLSARADLAELEARTRAGDARFADLTDELTTAVVTLRNAGDRVGEAKAEHLAAIALGTSGRNAEAEAALDRALGLARATGDMRRLSAVLSVAPLAALWGPSPVSRASGRCLDIVRILRMTPGYRHVEARALRAQAELEAMRGRVDAARSILAACRTTFSELGLEPDVLDTAVSAGRVELLAGDPAAAAGHLRTARDGLTRRGLGAALATALLARALGEQGHDGEPLALCDEAEDHAGDHLKALGVVAGARALVLGRLGQHDAAVAVVQTAARGFEDTDAITDHADARLDLARALLAAGRSAEAATAAAHARELYAAKGHEVGVARSSALEAAASAGGMGAAPTGGVASAGGGATPAAYVEPGAAAAAPREALADEPLHRLAARWVSIFNERDWTGLDTMCAADFVFLDHRPGTPFPETRGVADYAARQRSLVELAPDARITTVVLAGDASVGLLRWSGSGTTPDGGGYDMAAIASVRLEGERVSLIELFDPSDELAAYRRLADLRPLAPTTAPAALVYRRALEAINARDWSALAGLSSPDHEHVDHRRSGLGEVDGKTWQSDIAIAVQAAPDLAIDADLLAIAGNVVLARALLYGSVPGGGAATVTVLQVSQLRDGRLARLENFEPDQLDAAWGRFCDLR